nr:MAG TPA: hypothetical protein [Caudoviricetes sp.]
MVLKKADPHKVSQMVRMELGYFSVTPLNFPPLVLTSMKRPVVRFAFTLRPVRGLWY